MIWRKLCSEAEPSLSFFRCTCRSGSCLAITRFASNAATLRSRPELRLFLTAAFYGAHDRTVLNSTTPRTRRDQLVQIVPQPCKPFDPFLNFVPLFARSGLHRDALGIWCRAQLQNFRDFCQRKSELLSAGYEFQPPKRVTTIVPRAAVNWARRLSDKALLFIKSDRLDAYPGLARGLADLEWLHRGLPPSPSS